MDSKALQHLAPYLLLVASPIPNFVLEAFYYYY
jgi:hypothetical protein